MVAGSRQCLTIDHEERRSSRLAGNQLGSGGGNAEDDLNCRCFDNRAEGLVVVDVVALEKVVNHLACFVSCEGAVEVELVLKDPLSHHNVGARG